MVKYVIREAIRSDMGYVLQMIKDLHDFLQFTDPITLTERELIRDGFDLPYPLFSCLVAEDTSTKELVGYLIYYTKYSIRLGEAIWLKDLFVKKGHQKQGVGKQLFLCVAKKAKDLGTKLEFCVLQWNPNMAFYKKMGAINVTEKEQVTMMRFDEDHWDLLFKSSASNGKL